MDSQWFNQQINNRDLPNNIAEDTVDLTLKLGLPNKSHNSEKNKQIQFDFARLAPNLTTQPPQGQKQNEISNSNNITSGQSLNANNFAWQSNLENQFHAQYMRPNGYEFGQFSAPAFSSMLGPPPSSTFPMYPNTYNYNNSNMNPHPNFMLPPPPTMNNYILLDVPTRRATMNELERSSSSRRYGLQQQQCVGSYNSPFKRCTNYNCNTNDTPMWRRGPLGHKTLCNACGIKYRKEEEKRKAKEDSSNQKSNNDFS